MMETFQNDAQVNTMNSVAAASDTLQFGVDILSILIGIFAFILAIRLIRKLGGSINQALKFFIAGVVCNAVAIGWSMAFEHGYVLGGMYIDIHQNLMTLGMIFFIISTFRFSKLVRGV